MRARRQARLSGSSKRLMAAGISLHVDVVTAEVVTALREAGVDSVLLRGPAIARWLYDDETWRSYVDVDLLVPHGELEGAQEILAGLGFSDMTVEGVLTDDRPTHARTLGRGRDGAVVDLHYTVLGVRASPDAAWQVLGGQTEAISVVGTPVEILTPPGRAFVVAVHAAQHGAGVGKPLDDLARALEALPARTWAEASDLAMRLDATQAFGAGLRLLARGEAVARRLELPEEQSIETALRVSTPPPMALGFDWLARTPGVRAKARLVARKVGPEPAFMRAWSPLAQRGRVGLTVAYIWRVLWLIRHAWPGFRAWRHARRATR
jgi:hypothetical protein